ncbi:MAG: protein phosphatase 2C domain-containing protein [Methylacidiphilales bacterium]|nr:protein phosphatase 2C domain-containing protein [Candidatus Methylacidiphilales bacterium]
MNKQLVWRSCGFSNVGAGHRKINEDSFLTLPDQMLWVVADGMGGHARGDVASSKIKQAFENFSLKKSLSSTIENIEDTLISLNKELRMNLATNGNQIMGSTVAMLLGYGSNAYFLWSGDSRIYIYRDNLLSMVTHDHSYVQEIVDRGQITLEEAEKHPSANIITRAVGAVEELYVDIDCLPVKPGDKFLLCSDGLYKALSNEEIRVQLFDIPMRAAENLIAKALENHADDNVTVIVVEVSDT